MINKKRNTGLCIFAIVAGVAALGAGVAIACTKLIDFPMLMNKKHCCWDDVEFDEDMDMVDDGEPIDLDIEIQDQVSTEPDDEIQPKPYEEENEL